MVRYAICAAFRLSEKSYAAHTQNLKIGCNTRPSVV